jgi:hypothetical protein
VAFSSCSTSRFYVLKATVEQLDEWCNFFSGKRDENGSNIPFFIFDEIAVATQASGRGFNLFINFDGAKE